MSAMDNIDRKARVWTITLGIDGKLVSELDAGRAARLKRAA